MANILLVDDDLDNLWALRVALEGDGHRVSVGSDARRALEILRREPIQFVITDREMPGMDGVELCRVMRSQPEHCALPIFLLSGASEPIYEPPLWNRFFLKPVPLEELDAAIRAAIDAYSANRLPSPAGRQKGIDASPRQRTVSMRAALRTQHLAASRWAAVCSKCCP